jgi:opacity protein-like surface antigen
MNKITKCIVGAVCAVALLTSTYAADSNTVATANTSVQTTQTSGLSLFNAKEFGLSLASGYTLGGNVSSLGATSFQDPYSLNFNAGAFYFPWRNLGFEANVPFYQSKGVSVSEVQAGLVLRLPLSKEIAILKNLSPYVGVDAVYNWNSTQEWAYIGKVGLEARLNKNWGAFVEGQYRNSEFKDWGNGQATLNGGLRLVF